MAASDKAAALALERDTLTRSWGPNFETNKFVAAQAARALGVDPATVTALENQVGYAKVMEMFRNIGTKIGEDKFVAGAAPAGNGAFTREQAMERKAELMRDGAWVAKYLAGDNQAGREMTGLNVMISGDSRVA